MKNILITGGSGFLGRQIVYFAKEMGYNVFAPRSYEFNLETNEGIDNYFNKLKNSNNNIDCIIHSAAYYGGIGINQTDPAGLITRNTKMTVNIFKSAAKWNVKKLISVGSACSYPGNITDELYERDMFNGRCHDSVEAYGFYKRTHLVFQKAYYKQYGIKANQLVLASLYGEHDVFNDKRSHVIAALIKKVVEAKQNNSAVYAWGTGKPKREFIYVKDAAKIIVKAIEFEHDLEPTNVNGEEISIFNLANLIANIVGLGKGKVEWDSAKPDGAARKVLNGDKLKKLVPDFKRVALKDGLRKTIEWYIANKQEADARE